MRLQLVRIDPPAGVWRWYALSVEADLFCGARFVREWGRVGAPPGGRRVEPHPDVPAAEAALRRWLRRKTRRGYRRRGA